LAKLVPLAWRGSLAYRDLLITQKESVMETVYYLTRITMPGSAHKWALESDGSSEFHDTYRTKKDALAAALAEGLTIGKAKAPRRARSSDRFTGCTSIRRV
jgi:hypothetical protein